MDEQEERKQSAIKGWILGLAVGAVILGALATAYQIGRNNAEGETTTAASETAATDATTTEATPTEGTGATTETTTGDAGAELFASGCGSCHTLSAADTTGTTGPNLDDLQPDAQTVAAAIANGGTGSGVMPSNIYSGQEAQQVAEYVSTAAGQ